MGRMKIMKELFTVVMGFVLLLATIPILIQAQAQDQEQAL
jgi:hypothetical protein